jgi:uncharacterized protein YndB with AHSA1/START domain
MSVIRVAIGAPEAHGSTWRVWQSGSADDLYVGTRGTAGEIKVSLHASGDFRYAFTQPHVESDRALVTPDQRVIERWRPLAVQPGVRLAFSMRQPWFAATMTDPLKAKVTLVPSASEGNQRVLSVVMVHAGIRPVATAPAGGMPIGPVPLPSGATAWVVVGEAPIPAPALADMNAKGAVRVAGGGDPLTGVRVFLLGADDAGVWSVTDVPVTPRGDE